MQPDARSWRMEAVQAHPLAELLECPPETGNLLNRTAQCIDFAAGDIVFRQSGICQGSTSWFQDSFSAGRNACSRG